MLKNLGLERPLAVLALETTGTDARVNRIVEVSVLKLFPDGRVEHKTRRVNPGVPIPAEASAVHGITDDDVADEPSFKSFAKDLLKLLDGCDLCGFNIKKFDLRVLVAEFQRAGHAFPLEGRVVVDPMEIYHAYERRDLTAAVRFYCGREHQNGHAAAADARATAEVLDAMLARYDDLPRTIAELGRRFGAAAVVDADGKFRRDQGQVRFTFGKYRGVALAEVLRLDRPYLEWLLGQDFAADTKAVVRQALEPGSS